MNKLECNCSWHFSKQSPASQDVGPNNAATEHFSATPYPSLIRESIQNSLDVVLDRMQPVRMKFEFGNLRSKTFEAFYELREHIKGVSLLYKNKAGMQYAGMLDCFDNIIRNQKNIGYIKVSDYNTKGMDYKPDDSPFHAFVRAVGLTVKDDDASGGSFGFGKAAYFMMSPIHAVLVSTKTSEGKTFFEGAASLCTHLYPDETGRLVKYQHYGFYDNQNGQCPASNIEEIPSKFRRVETGTDIYIMGVNASDLFVEQAYQEMIESALRNFWMAFLHNKLEVQIGESVINHSNLDEWMKSTFPDLQDTSRKGDEYNPRPYYEAVKNANSSGKYVQITDNLPFLGEVSLYVGKNEETRGGVVHFRKQRMFIFRERSYNTVHGYHAVFLCTNNKGNQYLQSVEDPSHKKWDAQRNNECGKLIINEIKDFIKVSLQKIFTATDEGPLHVTGLEDYLFVPEELIANDKENVEDNPFFGDPSGNLQEEGSSPIAIMKSPDVEFHPDRKGSLGNVVISSPKKGMGASSAGTLGGHKRTNGKSKQRGKGASPDFFSFTEGSGGLEGKFLENIPVRYRVMAESKNGRLIHTLLIDSDYNVQNGQIEILVSGEEIDEVVDIISSSNGKPTKNVISNVTLSAFCKNIIEIEFVDNMRHAIKLAVYEFK